MKNENTKEYEPVDVQVLNNVAAWALRYKTTNRYGRLLFMFLMGINS